MERQKGGLNLAIDGINTVIRAWNDLSFGMGGIDLGFGKSIPGFNIPTPDLPTIPRLASGLGFVPRQLPGHAAPR